MQPCMPEPRLPDQRRLVGEGQARWGQTGSNLPELRARGGDKMNKIDEAIIVLKTALDSIPDDDAVRILPDRARSILRQVIELLEEST